MTNGRSHCCNKKQKKVKFYRNRIELQKRSKINENDLNLQPLHYFNGNLYFSNEQFMLGE